MKLSIVMAYYNRRRLLINTLRSIDDDMNRQGVIPYTLETIIVDDGSDAHNDISDLKWAFPSLGVKIIRVNPSEKWWINPCIPYNIGFAHVTGDKVVIQNPECLHIGSILDEVYKQKDNEYTAFGAYAVGPALTASISAVDVLDNIVDSTAAIIAPYIYNEDVSLSRGYEKWYQHSIHNPAAIHFCCAIDTPSLRALSGFDERFATGIAYDDREFIVRVRRSGMKIKFIDMPFVVHQCHGYTDYSNQVLVRKNEDLLNEVQSSAHIMAPNRIDYKNIGELL